MRHWRLLGLLTATAVSASAQQATPAQIDWIRKNAVGVETVEAGHGFADLAPLKQLVGEARIVALGEPTHGSREVFQMKHRLLEFLIKELGFSIFSIEANMPESFRVNDYVMRGEGNPSRLIRGMYFWTWATEEVREMVEWMRRHNAESEKAGNGSRVRFTGFDVQTPDVAAEIVANFIETAEPDYVATVREAVKAASGARKDARGSAFGVATGTFPVERARGKKVSYRGWIRTEGLVDGFAGLWWRCDAGREARCFDNMQDRGPRGTTDWQRFEIVLSVPIETTNINFGVLMPGRGKAWFDGLEIELDGERFVDPSLDLDFEGSGLKGFMTPSTSYRVGSDAEVAKVGSRSLRIQGAPAEDRGNDPVTAAAAWQAVVAHLEQSRPRYSNEADRVSLDWALVNARLVKDAMEIRSSRGTSVRDRAMAAKVAWILEQSPKARIVLWAHNGHVQRQAGWMGQFLEDQFPGQMVVMGFATGSGTYRAVSRAGKGLGRHALATAPPDSIEHVFEAARLPRFVLDLRRAVPGSFDSGWLAEDRPFRSIGAMELVDQFFPMKIRDRFDAVVWIEKTSAATPLAN